MDGEPDAAALKLEKLEVKDKEQSSSVITEKIVKHAKIRTGLVFDQRMCQHYCLWDHAFPECPDRITKAYKRCVHYGLVQRCVRVEARQATMDEVRIQHSDEYIEAIRTSSETRDLRELEEMCSNYHGIYMNPLSWDAALMSLGSTIELCERVARGQLDNGLALVRPPGHHAQTSEACGYCFFNNVAVTAKHLLNTGLCQRILIVDWDVHHGQGTQYMFYDDPRVIYFSIHRYEGGRFWPNLRESDYDYTGSGSGRGYNINVPLNETGVGDMDYITIFHQLLLPIAYQFQPDIVLVSAGYDAAVGCAEGEMSVSPACYAHLTHMLSSLAAAGRVALILEGGYCIKSLSESVALTLRELLGDPCPMLPAVPSVSATPIHDSVVESILNAITVLRPYWHCLQYQGTLLTARYTPPQYGPDVIFYTEQSKPERHNVRDPVYPVQTVERVLHWENVIQTLINTTPLLTSKYRTCVAYDAEMCSHFDEKDPFHPEVPDRISSIYERLKESGVWDKCVHVESREVERAVIHTLHSPAYVATLERTRHMSLTQLQRMKSRYESVYFSRHTFRCALLAAGNLCAAVDSVMSRHTLNGFAVVRPPGHHAECDHAKGFSYLNNVALAARYAQERYPGGESTCRVMIVDWDVHHGNGTQNMFYDDTSVLYVSIHRFDHGYFYPCLPQADCTHVGGPSARGYNINIAWNDCDKGDTEYAAAFQQVVMPVGYEFAPHLVLVSCGFDSGRDDPLGHLDVTPAGFAHITRELMSLAGGRLVLALEGGYNLDTISASAQACMTALLWGPPAGTEDRGQVNKGAVKSIKATIKQLSPYWKCLQFNAALPQMPLQDDEKKRQDNDSASQDVDDDGNIAETEHGDGNPTSEVNVNDLGEQLEKTLALNKL